MADNKKEMERAELHMTIWGIADEMRCSVDGWDFMSYILGMLFYRYASMNLRSKKELIENFVDSVNYGDDVNGAWEEYVKQKKEEELTAIIKEEKLKASETRKFIDNAFRDGQVRTTGTDIDKILPPMSRFGGGGNRSYKKALVIEKIQEFFEKYIGL